MSSGLTGNWGQINIHLRNLQRARVKEKPLMAIAQIVANQVRKNIENQSLDFIPLNPQYLDRKVSEGYDERILIRTSEYVNSIEVKEVEHVGDRYFVTVGVAEGTTENGLDLEELAAYLEYGTIRMPGRYPITMTWESMKDRLRQELVQMIQVELREGWVD